MYEAREDNARLLSGEGLQSDTGDSTVDTPLSAKKFPSYLRLLPAAEIDPHHLLAEPVHHPQLKDPSVESHDRHTRLQIYNSPIIRTERTVVRAFDRMRHDLYSVALTAVGVSLVGVLVAERLIQRDSSRIERTDVHSLSKKIIR